MGKGVGLGVCISGPGCILVVRRIRFLISMEGGFSDYLEGPAWIVVVCNLDLKVQKKNTIAFSFIVYMTFSRCLQCNDQREICFPNLFRFDMKRIRKSSHEQRRQRRIRRVGFRQPIKRRINRNCAADDTDLMRDRSIDP
jgi:hypothetical protein